MKKLLLFKIACAGSLFIPTSLVLAEPASEPVVTKTPLLPTGLDNPIRLPTAGTNAALPGMSGRPMLPIVPTPPERPARPPAPEVSPDVKSLVQRFQEQRDAVLKERESARNGILERLRTASGEGKEKLLEELREKQRAWMQEQKALHEEYRARLKTMREEFKNRERDKLLDEVKLKVKDLTGRGGQD